MQETQIELGTAPSLFLIEFDGKRPFAGTAVFPSFNEKAAEDAFKQSVPEEVTDLKVISIREMTGEERDAFYQNLEGSTTKH